MLQFADSNIASLAPKGWHVLVIDDNEIDIFIHSTLLQQMSVARRIEQKNKAAEALQYIQEAPKDSEDLPDIILLDINMPLMNGHQFLEEFHQTNKNMRSDKCKVIVLSSTVDEEEIQQITQHERVVQFIEKPLTFDKMEEIKCMLQHYEQSAAI